MGDFKINEKTVFTQSGSAEPAMGSTITDIPSAGLTGTLPSGVSLASATFPSGHVLKQSFIGDENLSANIACVSTTMADSGLEISHTTDSSSADSYLIFEFYSGMQHQGTAATSFIQEVHMRTVSNGDWNLVADEAIDASTYHTYTDFASTAYYRPQYIRNYCGLVSGMGMPTTKSSWAAGDVLYFRIFFKRLSGNCYIVHADSFYNLSVTEVKR